MTVSILMATYNGERYIDKQILSIIAQSHSDWHLVIHDDGSNDNTVDIVKRFCKLDSRITFVEDNFTARNAGRHFMHLLQFGNAPFICFCDQDDIWFENKLEIMLRTIETKNNNIPQVVFSDAYLYHDISNRVDGKLLFVRPTKLSEILFTNGGIHGSASMFNVQMKTALMMKHDFVSMHDHILTLIGCSFGEVSYLNEKLFMYRQHQNNVTGNMNVSVSARLHKAFANDSNKYTIAIDTLRGAQSFLSAYGKQLSEQDLLLIENYLRLPTLRPFTRFCSIVLHKYSLNHSKIQLWIKLLTRRFLQKKMRTIVVNATALDSSGALSILRQFIEAIPTEKNVEYLVFISPNIQLNCDSLNVRLIPITGVKSLLKRFLWDAFGVQRWLKQNNIKPSASISLQNTNFRTGYSIPNYIYYHQPIPFFPFTWSPFKAQERTLWFYKNIYPFFVQIFLNRRTEVFVQLEFIKEGFTKRFGFERNKIHVVRPQINITPSNTGAPKLSADKINLFYPATPFFYKNHKMLFDALLRSENDKFTLSLTCEKEQFSYGIPSNVNFLGVINFQNVMAMYKECDALVFPSYIETYGLPLLEAASVGIPILCSDLPYAREVLCDYDGAIFIDHTNPNAWAEAINTLVKGRRYTPYQPLKKASWEKMFEIINHNLYV